ncbi:glycosyltransferase [Flavobacterium sp.]|uniref:glycosyltransferase n=1 Tax=Flavobacterium sp. TaxID=239 RepID=UPI00262F3A11|nr:glycosyltransferase [Flavobacterium sp.]MDG2433714.1 glycosyltransferase [Flavobacterium sp.]
MAKNIVFKVPEFPQISETFIVAQIVTAIQLGYDVKILVRRIANVDPKSCFDLIEEYDLMSKVIVEDYKRPNNKIFRLIKWFGVLSANLLDLPFILKYYKEYSKFSLTHLFEWVFYKQFITYEIVHIQFGNNKHPIDKLKKTGYFKPKVILTFHGHDAFFPLNGFIENNGYYDDLFKYANIITANTPYLADKVLELGCPSDKLIVIPVAVDTAFFKPKKNNNKVSKTLKLITVGRLDIVKGQSFCIESMKLLIQKGFDVTLKIIGEGTEQKNLENLIKKYDLANYVFLKGSQSREEIRTALWDHDVYLLTGQATVSGLRESQGLATIEAQACGLPAIVFDSGGVKYTIHDKITGFICDEFDVDRVVEKVELFYQNRELINDMGAQAAVFVKNEYAQNEIDKKWEIIYSTLSDEN